MKKKNILNRVISSLLILCMVILDIPLGNIVTVSASSFLSWDRLIKDNANDLINNNYVDIRSYIEKYHCVSNQTINSGTYEANANVDDWANNHFDNLIKETGSRITYGCAIKVKCGQEISFVIASEDTNNGTADLAKSGSPWTSNDGIDCTINWCPMEYNLSGYAMCNGPWVTVKNAWEVGKSECFYGYKDHPDRYKDNEDRYIVPIFKVGSWDANDGADWDVSFNGEKIQLYSNIYMVGSAFTYSWDLNGGSYGSTTSIPSWSRLGITNVDINITDPERSGYTFKGWKIEGTDSTNNSGYEHGVTVSSKVLYDMMNNGKFYKTLFGNCKFTAQWEAKTQYTISYNLNGGKGSVSSQTVYAGSSAKVQESTGITPPSGKHFTHWVLGSTNYYPGNSITPTSNITLIAHYESNVVSKGDVVPSNSTSNVSTQLWASNGNEAQKFVFEYALTENNIPYWRIKNYSTNAYLYFDYSNGNDVKSVKTNATNNSNYLWSVDVWTTKDSYASWRLDDNSKVIKAKWTPIEYNINYNSNGEDNT